MQYEAAIAFGNHSRPKVETPIATARAKKERRRMFMIGAMVEELVGGAFNGN